GGGGRGMRIVEKPAEMETAFNMAQSEARTAFGNSAMYLEKFILKPRHIEVQILADTFGNVVALGERECSIQRRHQKLVEESPSPAVTPEIRARLTKAAIAGARAANYVGAGTIEFLLDARGDYYFMEMNTRIQVEHPITEMVVGLDLIKYQILCHAGEPLPDWMHNIKLRGHAMECRINAEDPARDFMPSPGRITAFHMPGGMGVRVDTHAYSGYFIPPYYDSMIAKLIVHSPTREEALNRMEVALDECVIEGVKTIIPFHKQLFQDKKFRAGDIHTGFLETFKFEPDKD
ncbi:MAG: acetyl-CoA carboxylase biotin carboxylase subunit, partial [FCB group bacterium]|nr:acetyl-CoA carboxylase biotin carboxylase subunit [FCB group bacterium]